MGELNAKLLVDLAYALGIGLFVGLEREHHDISPGIPANEEPSAVPTTRGVGDTILGVRTFALLSLLGWGCAHGGLHWSWLPPMGLFAVGGFVVASYILVREGYGLTTEVAALLTYVMGALVAVNRPLAVALALATTLLLLSKQMMRNIIVKVRRVELSATLQLLILLAIVLPLLPTEPIDPWDAIPPQKIGLFVILIGGIGYVGYVLSRVVGQRRSAGVTGLVGGLTSSTAVTAAMAQAASRADTMRVPGQLAVFLANVVVFPRVLIVTAVLSREVALQLAYPLVGMGLVMLGGAFLKWRELKSEEATTVKEGEEEEPMFENPFALIPALKWGAVLCGVLLLAAIAKEVLGDNGLLAAAAASGLADVDAITLAVSQQAANETLAVNIAALAIAIAVISNTIVKGGIAVFAGGRAFGMSIAKVFLLSIIVGGGTAAGFVFL